jgi:hypothetical protein
MRPKLNPEIGLWYKDKENDLSFKVVAIEESDESILSKYKRNFSF